MKDKWNELKDHATTQMNKYKTLKSGTIGNLGAHIWKDVLNKMWSLEKDGDKE